MASRFWSWWRIQANFWIYWSGESYTTKELAFKSLWDDNNTYWKQKANLGMSPKAAVNTYFKFRR